VRERAANPGGGGGVGGGGFKNQIGGAELGNLLSDSVCVGDPSDHHERAIAQINESVICFP